MSSPKIIMPNGQVPTVGEPKQSAVIIDTEDGQRLAFPQVAVAMVSPDVIRAIAEAVHLIFNDAGKFYEPNLAEIVPEASDGSSVEIG
jgi:hypothetical protein